MSCHLDIICHTCSQHRFAYERYAYGMSTARLLSEINERLIVRNRILACEENTLIFFPSKKNEKHEPSWTDDM